MQSTRGVYLDLRLSRSLPSNIDVAKHNGSGPAYRTRAPPLAPAAQPPAQPLRSCSAPSASACSLDRRARPSIIRFKLAPSKGPCPCRPSALRPAVSDKAIDRPKGIPGLLTKRLALMDKTLCTWTPRQSRKVARPWRPCRRRVGSLPD